MNNRTLSGEDEVTLDSVDLIGNGIAVQGDYGTSSTFLGKDSTNQLAYVENPVKNSAGVHLTYDTATEKLNFDTNTDLTLDAQLTVNNTLKATAGFRAPLSQSSADHGLFQLAQGFMDIYHDAEDGEHIQKFVEVRVHNNISPHQFSVYKKDGTHPIFKIDCDDPDYNTEATIKIGASITFHEDNAYQLGSYNSRFSVIYSNNLIAGNTLIKLLEFDTHNETFVHNPLTSTTDTMVNLNTIVQIGSPYLWRPRTPPNYQLDHTCFDIYVHNTHTDTIGQYSNTVNLERQGATKNEIKLLNHLIPDGNINLGSIFNSYINIYSNSFTGNLIGNSDTATKISTIDNDNIVLKDSVQTISNKTISNSTFIGDLTGNADTATKISTIDNVNIVLKDSVQTISNKTISNSTFIGDLTGDVTGNADTSTSSSNLSSSVGIYGGISINRSLHPTETESWDLGRIPNQGNNFASELRFSAVLTDTLYAKELHDDMNILRHTLSNTGDITPGVNDSYDLGKYNLRFKNGWFNNVNIQDTLEIHANNVNFSNLPTSDPGVVGRLYVDNNFIKISDGN